MKRRVYGVLSLFAIAMLAAVPTVHAQARMIANVPFDFMVGQKSMAAGQYEIKAVSDQLDVIRNVNTNEAEFVIRARNLQSAKDEPAKLVFDRYGSQCFLRQIWDGNGNIGVQLPQSRREQELNLADNQFSVAPENVIVAMK